MKHRTAEILALAVASIVLAGPRAAAEEALQTSFVLVAGFPSADSDDADHGVLVIPGVVMSLGDTPSPVGSVEAEAAEVAALARKLESTLRLESVDVLYRHSELLTVDRRVTLPPPSATSGVRIEVTLQGYNRQIATYEVRFVDGTSTFADSVVSVPRRKRALVGGLDGAEAPYLFLVVEPTTGPSHLQPGFTPPQVIERTSPSYTPEAKASRIQGVVIVQAAIDREGRVGEVEVLKGLPMGLSEAAVETVRKWRFEPARDLQGEPVEVLYNLTFNFRLAEEPDGVEAKSPD